MNLVVKFEISFDPHEQAEYDAVVEQIKKFSMVEGSNQQTGPRAITLYEFIANYEQPNVSIPYMVDEVSYYHSILNESLY